MHPLRNAAYSTCLTKSKMHQFSCLVNTRTWKLVLRLISVSIRFQTTQEAGRLLPSHHPSQTSSSTNNFAHAQTLSRMSSLSDCMNIGRVNIEFFPGWKKIKQRRISFVLAIYIWYYEHFQLQYIFMFF